jgi:uncharacterized protein YndB with AHSA1/START domain
MPSQQLPPDTIELTYGFIASAEDIFDAWTDPSVMRRWMYSGESNDILQVITDPRPGGEFCLLKNDREKDLVDYCGTYHEVARPGLLSFSLESPLRFEGTSSVVIHITPDGDSCMMNFLQTGVNPSSLAGAWVRMFKHLEDLIAERTQS